jgi:PAS domain S-box-containing protein
MLAEELDFREIFKISHTAMALLNADLFFIDVNHEFIERSGRELEELIGRHFRDVFPRKTEATFSDARWDAVEAAITSGRREADHLIRYDVENPKTGIFEERYFTTKVQPIRSHGGEVEVYELSILELTPMVTELRALLAEQQPAGCGEL